MSEKAYISDTCHKPRGGLTTALHYPAFIVLWLSEALSLIGDRVIMVVLVSLVYDLTHSSGVVGLLMLLKAVPALFLGSVAGVFVDRWNRKWLMVGSNLLQGVLILFIPASDSLLVIFIVYFSMSVVNQLFIPARAASIPDLVPPQTLVAANSLFASAYVGALALGPALGGWIAERFGSNAAFYVDSGTFLVPALAVGLIAIPRAQPSRPTHDLRTDLREGFVLARSRADLLAALASISAAFLVVGTMSVLGIVIARESLNVGVGGFGIMMSAMGAGMLAGAIGIGSLRRNFDRTRLGATGVILTGLAVMILPWITQLSLALILSAILGFGVVVVQANSQTTLQSVSENMRGRIMGLSQVIMGVSSLLSVGLSGVLAGVLGDRTVLFGVGVVALIAGIIIATRFNPGETQTELGAHDAIR